MHLAHMPWKEAEAVLHKRDLVVIVPVGSTEQHGCLGPLGTDFMVVDHLARRIGERTEVLVTPTMPYGMAVHHTSFPGTIDIGLDALYGVIKGITTNLLQHGARRFLFLNGHGGNDPALERAGIEVFRQGGLCAQINWWSLAPMLNPDWITGHGDAQEVAMMRVIAPELVRDDCHEPTRVNHLTDNLENTHLAQVRFGKGLVKVIRDVRATVNTGAFGGLESSRGTLEWGQAMYDGVLDYCVDFINEFKTVDLDKARRHD